MESTPLNFSLLGLPESLKSEHVEVGSIRITAKKMTEVMVTMVISSDLRRIYQRILSRSITDVVVTCVTDANKDTCARQDILRREEELGKI